MNKVGLVVYSIVLGIIITYVTYIVVSLVLGIVFPCSLACIALIPIIIISLVLSFLFFSIITYRVTSGSLSRLDPTKRRKAGWVIFLSTLIGIAIIFVVWFDQYLITAFLGKLHYTLGKYFETRINVQR